MSHAGFSIVWAKIVSMRKLLLVSVVALSACAPKTVPVPVATAPKFPDFMRPAVPPAMAASPSAASASRGWAFLQTGDLKTAEREFGAALKAMPAFYPAVTALGYLELARKDPKAALQQFDRALDLNPMHDDVAAFIGRGQALLALNREADALGAFESALAADPSQTELARRVEVLRFRNVEQGLARARGAARDGRFDEAAQAYMSAIAGSPDSAFLYRELAGVERQRGDVEAALGHFRKAATLDPGDAASLAQIGEILDARGDFDGAAKAYSDALALEPRAELEKRLDELRAKAALARLPAEYRAISQAAQITRGDLAALIGVRLAGLLPAARPVDAGLVTDVRTHWAAAWILTVAGAGVIEPFANHAFQPRSIVRRTDLAQAVAHILARIAAQNPGRAKGWESARLKFSDLSPSHLAYPAASIAVASGVMKTAAGSSFQPSRAVTGTEAIDAMTIVQNLAGLR